MQPIQFFAARAEDGALLPGATVDVFVQGTGERAPLFLDSPCTVALGNPVSADANARVFFYTTTPRIDMRISRYGYVAPLIVDISTWDAATAVEWVRTEIDEALGEIGDSLTEMEQEFAAAQTDKEYRFRRFIMSSGYQHIGAYAPGLVISAYNQIFLKDGEFYRAPPSLDLPYTTTGVWAGESSNFVSVGDAALRQELSHESGSELVGYAQPGLGAAVRNVQDKLREVVAPEDFQVDRRYVADAFDEVAVSAAPLWDGAFAKGIAAAVASGRPFVMADRIYKLSHLPDFPTGLNISGPSVGRWKPTINTTIAGGAGAPNGKGTILLCTGTHVRDQYITGITDMRNGGGVLANSCVINPGYDDKYKLSSFYNEDANPATGAAATRKPISAFVRLQRGVHSVQARRFRIMLNNRGIKGYLDRDLTLGDECDVGLLINNAEHNTVEDVQVVGYWRVAGRLVISGTCGDQPDLPQTGIESNEFSRCTFTGMNGSEIRGPDSHRVVAVGADYIEIPWAANHPFSPSLLNGKIRQVGNNDPFFSFSGVAMSGANLRLTGVTPSPSASGMTTSSQITPGALGNGMGLFTDDNCIFSGLDHHAAVRATSPSLGAYRQTKPSAAFVLSGWRCRGYRAPFSKIITQDDVAYQIHQANDVILGPNFELESKGADGLGLGMRCISSPSEGLNVLAPNPAGQTFRFQLDILNVSTGSDLRPVRADVPARFPTGTGYAFANTLRIKAYHDMIDNGPYVRPSVNGSAGIKRPDGGAALTYDASIEKVRAHRDLQLETNVICDQGGVKRIAVIGGVVAYSTLFINRVDDATPANIRVSSTDWRGGTDASTDLGTPSIKMRTLYAQTGSINVSDARKKTPVRPFTVAERTVAQALLGEVGMYQFLDSIAEKGDAARWHAGLTVQRAIEIFEAHDLDPFRNAFVCYDQWDDIYEEWGAEFEVKPAIIDPETGHELEPETQVVTKEAGRQLVKAAGDLYSFRNDQLALAMLAGVAATQRDLEERLSALESR